MRLWLLHELGYCLQKLIDTNCKMKACKLFCRGSVLKKSHKQPWSEYPAAGKSHFPRWLGFNQQEGLGIGTGCDTLLPSTLKLDPALLSGSGCISLQRTCVWCSWAVVHIGLVSAELFLTTKNILERVTICCNHIFPVFLCDNYSHKYRCFTSAQPSALCLCAQSQPSRPWRWWKNDGSVCYCRDHLSWGSLHFWPSFCAVLADQKLPSETKTGKENVSNCANV